MDTWYRQDYDRWPDTHGHAPVTDRDFWFTLDGSSPTGTGVPFEHAELELFRYLMNQMNQRVVGAFLFGFGAGVLAPGPFDVMAAGIGFSIGGPVGAVVGVAAYNAFGLALLLTGAYLIGETIDWPDLPTVHWDRAGADHWQIGASPVESFF